MRSWVKELSASEYISEKIIPVIFMVDTPLNDFIGLDDGAGLDGPLVAHHGDAGPLARRAVLRPDRKSVV